MYIHRVNKSGITAFNNRACRTAINTIHSSIIRSSLPPFDTQIIFEISPLKDRFLDKTVPNIVFKLF